MTQEELMETFGEFGNLKDARLVTYRNGHSKGLAFVEYKDEVIWFFIWLFFGCMPIR